MARREHQSRLWLVHGTNFTHQGERLLYYPYYCACTSSTRTSQATCSVNHLGNDADEPDTDILDNNGAPTKADASGNVTPASTAAPKTATDVVFIVRVQRATYHGGNGKGGGGGSATQLLACGKWKIGAVVVMLYSST